jgi:hypothetical protein
MAVHDPELLEWNVQATAFLALSPCDQELYIAAVNAGADPELLLDAFCSGRVARRADGIRD